MVRGKKQSGLLVMAAVFACGVTTTTFATGPLSTTAGNGASLFDGSALEQDFESITLDTTDVGTTATDLFSGVIGGLTIVGEELFKDTAGNISVHDAGGGTVGTIVMRWASGVQSAGIDFFTSDSDLTFYALDMSGSVIAGWTTTSTGVPNADGFFGWKGDGVTLIYGIKVMDGGNTFQLDNLIVGTSIVPIPGAVLLGMFGLGTVGAFRRRFM